MPLRVLGQVEEEGLEEQLDMLMDHLEDRQLERDNWRWVEQRIAQPLRDMGLPYTDEQVQHCEEQISSVQCDVEYNRSSHLGIHKQTNACWSTPRSQTVFYHFKICRSSAESGNYEAFVLVDYWQLQ